MPMPVLSFLEGEGRGRAGRLIEILALNDHELERRRDFLQWLVALPEPSRAQPQSIHLALWYRDLGYLGRGLRHGWPQRDIGHRPSVPLDRR